MHTFRTLLVDDDIDAALRLGMEIEDRLGPTAIVPDAYQALDRLSEERFSAVVLEIALPGANGIDLLERLTVDIPAVVLTWLVSPAITARALAVGANAVLTKPCGAVEIVATLRRAASVSTAAVLVGT